MTRSPIVALLFDMDDTLFREVDYVDSAYRAVACWLAPIVDREPQALIDELWNIYNSPERARAFDALLNRSGHQALVAEAIRRYRDHMPQIALTPDARQTLAQLTVRVAIVTDGPAVMQESKARALGLTDRFPVVFTDEIGGRAAWKPSPVGLITASTILNVPPHRCAYVGDNPHKDFAAAKAAGMTSVRYRASFQLHQSCEPNAKDRPHLEIRALGDILRWLHG